MNYYLGIDGGGSKTTAAVCDETGRLCAKVLGDSVNYYALGLKKARANMAALLDSLQEEREVKRYRAAFIGMSALNGRATPEELRAFTEGILPADKAEMDSDLYIALELMRRDGLACVVVCGTGSMAAARDGSGQIVTTGGWGHLLGDEGSGYAVALAGMRAAIRGAEGSGPPTALSEALLWHFQIQTLRELIPLVYDPPIEKKEIAAFVPAVSRVAEEGDAVARSILEAGARDLAVTALALLKRFPKEIPIGLWGGIFERDPVFRELFTEALGAEGYANAFLLPQPPVAGALLAALRLDGRDLGPFPVGVDVRRPGGS